MLPIRFGQVSPALLVTFRRHTALALACTIALSGLVTSATLQSASANESARIQIQDELNSTYTPNANNVSTVDSVWLEQGSTIEAALMFDLSSRFNTIGDELTLVLLEDYQDEAGNTLVPADSTIQGTIVDAEDPKWARQKAKMTIDFHTLTTPDGSHHKINGVVDTKKGVLKGNRRRNRVKTFVASQAIKQGVGLAAGSIAGFGVGGALFVFGRKGKSVELAAGDTITVRLEDAVRTIAKTSPANSNLQTISMGPQDGMHNVTNTPTHDTPTSKQSSESPSDLSLDTFSPYYTPITPDGSYLNTPASKSNDVVIENDMPKLKPAYQGKTITLQEETFTTRDTPATPANQNKTTPSITPSVIPAVNTSTPSVTPVYYRPATINTSSAMPSVFNQANNASRYPSPYKVLPSTQTN